jgi:hypothetical protein
MELSWNSSRPEGNTHALLHTQRLIEKGIVAQGKDVQGKDVQGAQMDLNHKAAMKPA